MGLEPSILFDREGSGSLGINHRPEGLRTAPLLEGVKVPTFTINLSHSCRYINIPVPWSIFRRFEGGGNIHILDLFVW